MARSPLAPQLEAEYQALTEHVGVVELTDRTLLTLTGKDSVSFLHNLCTNHVKLLQPGEGCEAFITNVQGKLVGFTLVFREADQLVLDTAPDQAATLLAHFDRYIIREDVQLTDCSRTHADVLVCGPHASGLLQRVFEVQPPEALYGHFAVALGSAQVSVRRVAWGVQESYFLHCVRGHCDEVLERLVKAGAMPCSAGAADIVRIESGLPLYGRDIQNSNLPQEVNRDKSAISFVKGCYLGQETVARIDALGHVNQSLTGVRLHGQHIPDAGSELTVDGKKVGAITSSAWSPRLGAPIALAYLRRGHQQPGTIVSSTCGDATVVALPFLPR